MVNRSEGADSDVHAPTPSRTSALHGAHSEGLSSRRPRGLARDPPSAQDSSRVVS